MNRSFGVGIPVVVLLGGVLAAAVPQQDPTNRPTLPEAPFEYADVQLPAHVTGGAAGLGAAAEFDNTPIDNPVTDAGATLGRVLFYDTRLVKDDKREAAFPSLIPFRYMSWGEPMNDVYGPLLTLWRKRGMTDLQETRLVLDMFLFRNSREGRRISIPFLYGRRPEAGGISRHQLLWGVFAWRTGPRGLDSLTLLGLDLWTR